MPLWQWCRPTMDARDEMNELGQFIRDACEEGESDDGYVVSANALFRRVPKLGSREWRRPQ
jgi:hypothetical protein